MCRYYLLTFACTVVFLIGEVRSSKLSLMNVLDKTGKNLCIGDLHCFLDTDQEMVLTSNLTLDKEAVGWKFRVTIEKADEPTIADKKFNMCWEKNLSRIEMTEQDCENDVVPASSVPYAMVIKMHCPFFKDLALIYVTGPEDVETTRGLVCHHSAYPPITIPNCALGPC